MDLKYISRVLGGASFEKMKGCIDSIHEKSGKSKAVIFFDMLGCTIKYGAGYNDYNIFEYYNMKPAERKTYMTRLKNKKLHEMLNDPAYDDIFNKKNIFYEHFRDFLGRDFLDLSKADINDIRTFIDGKSEIIAKPSEGECGHGIEKIKLDNFENFNTFYAYITKKEKNFGVIEDVIVQHPEMSRLYPYSVNCFRIVTLLHENVPNVLYAVLKTGNDGNFVDNLESGGFACHFDLEKGVVCGPGHTSSLKICESHPVTGVKFEGFAPPYVNEAIELVKRAAMVIPQVRYIGWDVCITENGPAIIEGNIYAAYDFPQLPDEGRPRIGLLKQVEDIGIKL